MSVSPWLFLIIAGFFEITWVFFLKKTQGFAQLQFTVLFVASLLLSMFFLGLSLRSISISTAYPVWTGIGAIGAVALGVLYFQEPLGTAKLVFSSLIIIGIIGLKAT